MESTQQQTVAPNPSSVTPGAVSTVPQTVSSVGGEQLNLKQQIDSHEEDIKKLKQDLTNERLNNITIFGIFASLVTFFSIEIQVFKNIENFWLLIGLTSFLVSSMLLFVFSLQSIIRDRMNWKDFFKTPIFWIFLLFLIFSFVIFILNSKGINIDLKITSPLQK
ncbi:MAG TPA: hypothetical protein VJB37_00245 [Patescibacteria group bacterium]|nr:hypothetical protein [Patescibacteria group bacterium]